MALELLPEMVGDIGAIIQLNTALEDGPDPPNIEDMNINKTTKICIDEQNEEKLQRT